VSGQRVDRRQLGLLLTGAVIAAGGLAFNAAQSLHAPQAPPPTAPHAAQTQRLFDGAVVMLHARRYDDAVTALHRVLTYAPRMPEAHANMGFALLGLKQHAAARDFFEGAIALAPAQANAYYGLALVHEAQGDKTLATGAMRSYLHLARNERPEHLRRARAALWEWQQDKAAAASSPP
jgi:tetratricopeptide (TPR) repeat protein